MSLKQHITLAVIQDKIRSNAYNQQELHPLSTILNPEVSEEENYNFVQLLNEAIRITNRTGLDLFKSDCMEYLETTDYILTEDEKQAIERRLQIGKNLKERLEVFLLTIKRVTESSRRLKGDIVLSSTQTATLSFNPEIIAKTYTVRVSSSFEAYTGENMRLTLDKILKNNVEVSVAVFIRELLELADIHSYIQPRLDIEFGHRWLESESGHAAHAVLDTFVKHILITYTVL